jgi:hypothetical protein
MRCFILSLVLTLSASVFAQDSVNQKISQIQAENNARRIEAEQKRAEITNRVNARRAELEQIRASELQRAQQLKEAADDEN